MSTFCTHRNTQLYLYVYFLHTHRNTQFLNFVTSKLAFVLLVARASKVSGNKNTATVDLLIIFFTSKLMLSGENENKSRLFHMCLCVGKPGSCTWQARSLHLHVFAGKEARVLCVLVKFSTFKLSV